MKVRFESDNPVKRQFDGMLRELKVNEREKLILNGVSQEDVQKLIKERIVEISKKSVYVVLSGVPSVLTDSYLIGVFSTPESAKLLMKQKGKDSWYITKVVIDADMDDGTHENVDKAFGFKYEEIK